MVSVNSTVTEFSSYYATVQDHVRERRREYTTGRKPEIERRRSAGRSAQSLIRAPPHG